MAHENATVYHEQGGNKVIVASGGRVEIEAGGAIDIKAGAAVLANGAQVSPINDLTNNTGQVGDDTVAQVGSIRDLVLCTVFTGRNGAGAITLTGAGVGDTVLGVINLTNGSEASAAASFEAAITVANQIQQSAATDLSAVRFIVVLGRGRDSVINADIADLTAKVNALLAVVRGAGLVAQA